MLTDPQEFLRYFDGIHRRTLRDIQALPAPAESWAPPAGHGENAWSIAQIVHHICESRMYFARAYRNEGWLYDWEVPSTASLDDWVPALQTSLAEFRSRIDGTPADWLTRRIRMIDTDGMLSGWRGPDDDGGTRGAPSVADRHLRGHAGLGRAPDLRTHPGTD